MRHKAEWMGHPMRLELTHVGLLVQLANRYTTSRIYHSNMNYFSKKCKISSNETALT